MKKLTNFVIGAAIGTALGLVVHYLLGPDDMREDGEGSEDGILYRSRLDAALDAGRLAAAEREAELITSFEEAKRLS